MFDHEFGEDHRQELEALRLEYRQKLEEIRKDLEQANQLLLDTNDDLNDAMDMLDQIYEQSEPDGVVQAKITAFRIRMTNPELRCKK